MINRDLTTAKMARGLLADCVNVIAGLPTRPVAVSVFVADARHAKAKRGFLKALRTRLAFMLCLCTGCLQ